MYIPSLLVTHNGEALGDKTIFKKSEHIMKTACKKMLAKLGIKCTDVFIALGLEQ